MLNRTPFLIVLTAPSGTGKTTIVKRLLKLDSNLRYSVSATTRLPRRVEKDKRDYHFLKKEEFERWIREGKLLEYTYLFSHYYGTPKKRAIKYLNQGYDVIMDIDIEGSRSIKGLYPESVSIFLAPPSSEELLNRLKKRGESEEELKKRLSRFEKEMEAASEFTYFVINDNLSNTVRDILSIIRAERLKSERRI